MLFVPFGLWISYRSNQLRIVLRLWFLSFNLNRKHGGSKSIKEKSKFNGKISQKTKKMFRIIKKIVGLLEFIYKSSK